MFETNPVDLKDILDQVESGEMLLPDFQRSWIWDDDRIRGLLASISKGFPVGAVMTLEAGGNMNFKTRPIEGVTVQPDLEPEAFLLDGQQRLTALYQSLRFPDPVNTSNAKKQRIRRWYYIDMFMALDPNIDREDEAIQSIPENKKETADFGRAVTRDLSTQQSEYQQHMFPTESLMDPMRWSLGYFQYWEQSPEQHPAGSAVDFFEKFSKEIQENFKSYKLPVIKLGKATPKEAVCSVFEKVNTGGVTLTVFELVTASFAADPAGFSLRDDWEERRIRMHSQLGVLGGVSGDQFLQAVALLKTQEVRREAIRNGAVGSQVPAVACKKKDILELTLNDYKYWAPKVESGFMEAGRFLRNQYVFGRHNVPYSTQLVPLAALYVELGGELRPGVAQDRLAQWYWSGVFGEAYGGTTETQFALDLVEVARFVRGGPTPRLINEASFLAERLISLKTRNSAAYKGVMSLQMKNGARDWQTKEPLSVATFSDEHIDIHHVFPVAWCEKASPSVPKTLFDSIINKTPIDARTNRMIGGDAPSRYLVRLEKDMGSEEVLSAVLASHWFDISHLKEDRFAESFVARGEAMLKLIGEAMGRDLGSGRRAFLDALEKAGLPDAYLEEEEEPIEFGAADYLEEVSDAA